jgi:hypothetical protein
MIIKIQCFISTHKIPIFMQTTEFLSVSYNFIIKNRSKHLKKSKIDNIWTNIFTQSKNDFLENEEVLPRILQILVLLLRCIVC